MADLRLSRKCILIHQTVFPGPKSTILSSTEEMCRRPRNALRESRRRLQRDSDMKTPPSNGATMAEVEIVVVEGGRELKEFINLPWRIYTKYPRWVPPLKKEVRRMLDPRRHPFWASAERRLFLARRGSETVGRIAGIIDRRYNELHDEN